MEKARQIVGQGRDRSESGASTRKRVMAPLPLLPPSRFARRPPRAAGPGLMGRRFSVFSVSPW